MPLLHIYDSSDPNIVETAEVRGVKDKISVVNASDLTKALDAAVAAGSRYDRILFETHGAPGVIAFGKDGIGADWLRGSISHNYTALTTANARVYFNGCNVAEGAAGWRFLEAAAALFLTPGGGEVFGQTSLGLPNPFNGHVVHLWGTTRRLYVDNIGRVVEHFEQ
jgi:hypothetical protein